MFERETTNVWLVKPKLVMLSFVTLSMLVAVVLQPVQGATQVPPVWVPNVEEPTEAEPEVVVEAETSLAAAQQPGQFVVYVTRHAEREEDHVDPGLTRDGYRRADGLAQLLQHAGIEAIYSTYYRRNLGTALPLARELATPIEFYQAQTEEALVEQVLSQGRTALIIGHSNTVADIVNGLGGDTQPLSEDSYGDLFQLLIDTRGDTVEVYQVNLTAPLIMHERRQR